MQTTAAKCPGCSGDGIPVDGEPTLYRCDGCGGLFGTVSEPRLREMVNFSAPWMRQDEINEEATEYVDLRYASEAGPDRWHGWVDSTTRRIVQEG